MTCFVSCVEICLIYLSVCYCTIYHIKKEKKIMDFCTLDSNGLY